MPRFIVDKFYYVNINTNEKLSDIGFQAAYPFVGRKFTIIKIDDNFGIIDNNGRVVVKPTYKLFQLWNTPMRENFIALCRENNCSSFVVFDLDKGDYTIPNNSCAIPDYERERLIIFKSENQKYGVNQLDENYQNPKPVIKPVFDSIYDIRNSFIIAKKKMKIGVINGNSKIIIPFTYNRILLSSKRPNVIGLKNISNWEYYNLSDKLTLILKSKFECMNIGEIANKNGFGIYKINNKYNVLFKDGSSLNKNYDWISDNGTIGIDDNKVFIFGSDKTPFLYYEK